MKVGALKVVASGTERCPQRLWHPQCNSRCSKGWKSGHVKGLLGPKARATRKRPAAPSVRSNSIKENNSKVSGPGLLPLLNIPFLPCALEKKICLPFHRHKWHKCGASNLAGPDKHVDELVVNVGQETVLGETGTSFQDVRITFLGTRGRGKPK